MYGTGDNSGGLLYLSRMNPDADPNKGRRKRMMPERQKDEERTKEDGTQVAYSQEFVAYRSNKLRRFAVSLATLSTNGLERRSLVADGAVHALVALCREEDPITKMSCAMALRNLANEKDLRQTMLDAGAAAAIVSLTAAPDPEIQNHCAVSLVNLSSVCGGEAAIVQASAVPALLNMASASIHAMETILLTLCNLSCVEDMYSHIEDLNSAIVQLSNFSMSGRMEQMLVGCLCNLSCLKNNQGRLVEEGAVRIVNRIFRAAMAGRQWGKPGRDQVLHETTLLCAKTLSNLSSCSRSRSKMTAQRVIIVLLDMAKLADEDIKQSCALTITRLAMDVSCCEKIIHQGAMTAIVTMSQCGSKDIITGRLCAAALRQLCITGFENHLFEKMPRAQIKDAVKAVISLIGPDTRTNQNCSRTIYSLFQTELVDTMINDGALDAIVTLSGSRDSTIVMWCSRALYHLSCVKTHAAVMLEHGCQQALCDLCDIHYPDAIVRRSAATLWNLTRANSDNIDATALIPALIDLLAREEAAPALALANSSSLSGAALSASSGSNTKAYAIGALAQLAYSSANCRRMLAAGALMPIVELSRSGNLITRIQCGAILSRFSFQAAYRAHMLSEQRLSEQFLDALLDLSTLDDSPTQQRFIHAVVNMSYEPNARRLMLTNGVLRVLVDLSNKPDEQIRRGCAATFCNIAADEGSEKLVLQANAVPALLIIALVSSDRPETKEICAAALCNLLHNESTHQSMVNDGVIWGLAKLGIAKLHMSPTGVLAENLKIHKRCARTESAIASGKFVARVGEPGAITSKSRHVSSTDTMIMTAFCNLSFKFSYLILALPSAMKVVRAMIQSKVTATRRVAARTLLNLLIQLPTLEATNIDHGATKFSIFKMTEQLGSSDEGLTRIRLLALCLLSQSAPELITTQGILPPLDARSACADPQSALAYAHLCCNLAMSPSTDNVTIASHAPALAQLLEIPNINEHYRLELARWVYCVTNRIDAAEPLVTKNIMNIIFALASTATLIPFCVTALYNLSVEANVQASLVQQGAIEFTVDHWAIMGESERLLAALMACNLACGEVNTARIVKSGGSMVISYLASPDSSPFQCRCCAIALRNLVRVAANQRPMAASGAIDTLVALAALNDPLTTQHCASALRIFTYNKTTRDVLVRSGAISVILTDSQGTTGTDDDVRLPHLLLCRVETESWKNGSRSGQQEGRTPLPEPPILIENPHLICKTPTQLHFGLTKSQGLKIPAEIEMDEPELDPKQRADSMKDADDDCLPRGLLNNVDVELETRLCVYPKREYSEPRGLEPNCDGDASLAPKIRTDVDLPLPSQLEKLEEEAEEVPHADQQIAKRIGGHDHDRCQSPLSKQGSHMDSGVLGRKSSGPGVVNISHDGATSRTEVDPAFSYEDVSAAYSSTSGSHPRDDEKVHLPRIASNPSCIRVGQIGRPSQTKAADPGPRRTARALPRQNND